MKTCLHFHGFPPDSVGPEYKERVEERRIKA